MRLWGGNYSGDPDRDFWEFNRSFPFDRRLVTEEIAASRAWVRALARCQAVTADEADRLDGALERLAQQVQADPACLDLDAEDVHSFVETRLTEALGHLAGQAHLGRSRNEQAVTALRLWIRGAADRLREGVARLVEALAEQGRAGAEAVMPGYTHTRAAEPITFGHLAAAHAWALVRDHERLADARRRANVLPLGSGALAGTALPIDREALGRDLVRLLALMKGLPAGYQKDLQEDKEAVFDAADAASASVVVMTGVVAGLGLNREVMRRAAGREELMAAGLAVALARDGMPFRQAHALVGSLVAEARQTGASLREVAGRALAVQSPGVAARLDSVLDAEQAVRAKAARGGTAPDAVRESLAGAVERVRRR